MTSPPSDLGSRGSDRAFVDPLQSALPDPRTERSQTRHIAALESGLRHAIVEVQQRHETHRQGLDAEDSHADVIVAVLSGLLDRVARELGVDSCDWAHSIGLEATPSPAIEALAKLELAHCLRPETFAAAASVLTAPESRKLEGVVLTPPDVAKLATALGLATLAGERDAVRRRPAAHWIRAWLDPKHEHELGSSPFRIARILDPAAGTGAFLVASARALETLALANESEAQHDRNHPAERRREILESSIVGYERDPTTARVARFALFLYWLEPVRMGACPVPEELPDFARTVRVFDPLVDTVPADERFDLVLANPPYVRQELIPRDRKREIHRRFATGDAAKLSQRSDLYVYFFALLPQLLRERGTAVMLTSNSWLNAGYGVELRRFLTSALRLRLVLEPRDERWFGATQIHTTITVACRSAGVRERDDEAASVGFVSVSDPISAIARDPARAAELLQPNTDTNSGTDTDASTARGIRRVDVATTELAPAERTAAATPWGVWLAAPGVFLEVLAAGSHAAGSDAAGDRGFRPLREVASLRFGLKTGANAFFYVRDVTDTIDDDACRARFGLSRDALGERGACIVQPYSGARSPDATFPIERRFLRPVFVTPKEARGFTVRRADLEGLAIVLPPDEAALEGTFASEHVNRGRALGIDRRPSCASRAAWWSLPEPETPPLAHALIAHQRPALFGIPEGILVDANLVRIEPFDEAFGRTCVAATLLSSFGLLARELYLMTNLGDGAIKANPIYLGGVPAIAPATLAANSAAATKLATAIDALVANDYGSIDDEIASPARTALDDAFLQAIGIDRTKERDRLGSDLRHALASAIRSRTRRSRAERTH